MRIKMSERFNRQNPFNKYNLKNLESTLNKELADELEWNPSLLKQILLLSGQVEDVEDLPVIKRYVVKQEEQANEHGRADITIYSKDFVVIIELKLMSNEHKDGSGERSQLENYKELAADFKSSYPNADDYYVLIYPKVNRFSDNIMQAAEQAGYGTIVLEDLFQSVKSSEFTEYGRSFLDYIESYEQNMQHREIDESNSYKKSVIEKRLDYYSKKYSLSWRLDNNGIYRIFSENLITSASFLIIPTRGSTKTKEGMKEAVPIEIADKLIFSTQGINDKQFQRELEWAGLYPRVWIEGKDDDEEETKNRIEDSVSDFVKLIDDQELYIAKRHPELSSEHRKEVKKAEQEQGKEIVSRRQNSSGIFILTKNGKELKSFEASSKKKQFMFNLIQMIIEEEGYEKTLDRLLKEDCAQSYSDFKKEQPTVSKQTYFVFCTDGTLKKMYKNDLLKEDLSENIEAVIRAHLPADRMYRKSKKIISCFPELHLDIEVKESKIQ